MVSRIITFCKRHWVAILVPLVLYILYRNYNKPINYIMNRNLHPEFKKKVDLFFADVEAIGWKPIVNNGTRTIAEQLLLFKKNTAPGVTPVIKNSAPGSSYHNFGMAIDANFQKGTTILKKSDTDKKWLDSGIPQLAKKHGLFWGGDLSTYQDAVHFDGRNIATIPTLKAKAIQQFGSLEKMNVETLNLA